MIKFTIRQILFFSVLFLGLVAGIYIFFQNKFNLSHKAEDTTIILEKIKTVTKLIAVEGQFSELYSYKESYDYDFFNLFSKKMILRVNAKVSVGYDFEKVNISIDSLHKTITLNELPNPEILSIDHDLDYYDIDEGIFTKFTAAEYTKISKSAKNLITSKAKNTPLITTAEKQKDEYLRMMDMALKSGGWQLIIKDKTPLLQ